MQGYKSVNEIAVLWNVNPRTVRGMCKEGRIVGAEKVGRDWIIPNDAKRPKDNRIISGKYCNWRKES